MPIEIPMSHITLTTPAPIAVPRGAPLAGNLFAAVLNTVARLWRAQERARRQWRLAGEAAALRRHAMEISATNPGFAADLFAAADRHFELED
jgi:hypothetical protein